MEITDFMEILKTRVQPNGNQNLLFKFFFSLSTWEKTRATLFSNFATLSSKQPVGHKGGQQEGLAEAETHQKTTAN